MIRVLRYSKGKTKEVSNFDTKDAAFYWIYCFDATLKDLHKVSEKTKVDIYDIKHVLDHQEHPRIENKKTYSLVIFRGLLHSTHSKKITSPIEFILGKNFMITLTSEHHDTISNIFENSDLNYVKEVFNLGFVVLLSRILIALVREYNAYLLGVDEEINTLEDAATDAKQKDLHKLFLIKRRIFHLRRYLEADKDVLLSLDEGTVQYIRPYELFHDLMTEMDQIISGGEMMKDRTTGITEIYFIAVSNRLNEIMKGFTAIASILLVPALVSSIYGMNIALPLDKHPYAFLIVMVIIIILMAIFFIYFKRKKWL